MDLTSAHRLAGKPARDEPLLGRFRPDPSQQNQSQPNQGLDSGCLRFQQSEGGWQGQGLPDQALPPVRRRRGPVNPSRHHAVLADPGSRGLPLAPDHAMDFVVLRQEQLRQIGAVLPRDARDEGFLQDSNSRR